MTERRCFYLGMELKILAIKQKFHLLNKFFFGQHIKAFISFSSNLTYHQDLHKQIFFFSLRNKKDKPQSKLQNNFYKVKCLKTFLTAKYRCFVWSKIVETETQVNNRWHNLTLEAFLLRNIVTLKAKTCFKVHLLIILYLN